MSRYKCLDCGWIYDEELGSPEDGILPGTKWADVPMEFKCHECSNRRKNVQRWMRIRE